MPPEFESRRMKPASEYATVFTIASAWLVFLYTGGTADMFVTSLFVTLGMVVGYAIVSVIERVV